MGFYFLNESMRRPAGSLDFLHEDIEVPITVKKATWVQFDDPRRLAKIYRFDDLGQQRYFIDELMKVVDVHRHSVKITIEGKNVQVETHTAEIDDVTEIDLQIARVADEIFDDAQFILDVE